MHPYNKTEFCYLFYVLTNMGRCRRHRRSPPQIRAPKIVQHFYKEKGRGEEQFHFRHSQWNLPIASGKTNIRIQLYRWVTYVTLRSPSALTGGLAGMLMASMPGAFSCISLSRTWTEMRAMVGSCRWVRYTPLAVATVKCLVDRNHRTNGGGRV